MENKQECMVTETIHKDTNTNNIAPLRVWPKYGLNHLAHTSEGSAYATTSVGSAHSEYPTATLVPSMNVKYDPRQDDTTVSRTIMDLGGIPLSSDSLPNGVTNHDINTTPPESSGKSSDNNIGISNAGNNTNNSKDSEHHNSEVPKCKTRIVPRIVIPDGTSINLSTPPTTPRQQHRSFNFSQPSVWSHNLTQILERLGTRNFWSNTPHGRQTDYDQDAGYQQHLQGLTQIQQKEIQGSHNEEINFTNSSPNDLHTPPKKIPREVDGLEDRHVSLPQYGVMGVPLHGYRSESISSDGNSSWLDDEEETPGAYFSRKRWNYLLCTRKGLAKSFKHTITTVFGLLIITAIGLTAVGKLRDQKQVSDYLPSSLANSVMEAQIVVIKDFDRHLQSNNLKRRYPGSHHHTAHSQPSEAQVEAKIPIWTGPIDPHCFHRKCDIEHFGVEYFAFLNPESFGISLPNNWPSLCNSCIEITLNMFVYKTKARILGDLLTCPVSPSVSETSNVNLTEAMATMSSQPTPTTITSTTAIASKSSSLTSLGYSATFTTTLMIPTQLPKTYQPQTKYSKQLSSSRPTFSTPNPITTRAVNAKTERDLINDPKIAFQQHTQLRQREKLREIDIGYSLRPVPTHPAAQGTQKRQGRTSNLSQPSPTASSSAVVAKLPYLIVDLATFSNLTAYETQDELQTLNSLAVHFRFVLCDNY
ncbi:hypothetical protein BGZ49_005787 [Haplosporangium sp. Z 27]|nr:hypothetical protein BGZ49_005787 [Haplosporangium sp. Z 27]